MLVVHVKDGEYVRFRQNGQEFWVQLSRHSASWTKVVVDAPREVEVRRLETRWDNREPVPCST